MRIGIYNPYFDSVSGGERYTLALASHWSQAHRVDIFWNDPAIVTQAHERLHLDLAKVGVVPNIFLNGNLLQKLLVSRAYDLIFFLSDGSIPASLAKHNILHFQMPIDVISSPGWKLERYDVIVCNSNFTKNNLDHKLQKKALVIYPPVITHVSKSDNKAKIILTVGRFHSGKKQDVLIEAFKKLAKKKPFTGWRFICIGGLLPSDKQYFLSLQEASEGYPITLVPNVSFEELEEFYRQASLYWHAAGFGEQDPKLQEHFGISTVEAMAYGCIPIVYNGGGLTEIIKEGSSGFLWNTQEELLNKTEIALRSESLTQRMRAQCIKRSHSFDETKFFTAFDELLRRIIP